MVVDIDYERDYQASVYILARVIRYVHVHSYRGLTIQYTHHQVGVTDVMLDDPTP